MQELLVDNQAAIAVITVAICFVALIIKIISRKK